MRIGLWSATALVVGHTIGVGIFLTPAELIGALASPALTLALWLGCGLLVLFGAFTFGELASRYPRAGGPYIYLREGWGAQLAFLYGWQSLLIMDPGVTAALATGLSEYLVLLWPSAAGSERWLAVAVIWLLAGLSIGGLTLSTRVLGALTALKLAAFAGVAVTALVFGTGDWTHFQPFIGRQPGTAPAGGAIAIALVGVFFSFGGFWEASRIAGEVRSATRTMPLALAIGVTCVTAVYVVTTVAFIYLVPAEQATSAAEFARRAGEAMFGRAGPAILALVVVLSVTASILALLIMAPRLYVAMSHDRLFPSAIASVSASTQTPARATMLLAFMASLFALVGSFQQIIAFFMCTTLMFVALAAAALIVVRRRAHQPAIFSSPGYPVTTMLFIALVAAVVVLVAINRPIEAITGLAIAALGLVAYRLLVRRNAL